MRFVNIYNNFLKDMLHVQILYIHVHGRKRLKCKTQNCNKEINCVLAD